MISELIGRGSLCISARPSQVVHNERRAETSEDDGGGQVPGTHTGRGGHQMGGGATLIDTSARDVMRIPSPTTTTTTVAPHWWYKTCLTAVHHLSHFHFFFFFFPVISHPLHFRQKGTRSTIPLMFSTMKQSSAVVEHGKQQEREKDAIWRSNCGR